MIFLKNKKTLVFTFLMLIVVIAQSFTSHEGEKDEKAKNLKVLPKKISGEDLHMLMRDYSKALGVRCGHCHASAQDNPKSLDFVSDAKPEKNIARKMIKMQNSINRKYISKIGDHNFEKITCVTCHMGRIKPIITADSLVRK